MKILCNGSPLEVADSLSLQQLVQDLGYSGFGMAVAINETVVPRSLWQETLLHSEARVLLIQAAQGG